MLKTTLFDKVQSNETMANIALTVKFEGYEMTIEQLTDKAKAVQKKLENKNGKATAEMLAGYASELETIAKDIADTKAKADEIRATAETIEQTLSKKLARILACVDNSKLEKYAIEWTDADADDLYDALANLNGFKADAVDENNITKSENLISKIVRLNLTIDETEYNKKVAIRLNKDDFRIINQTWTTGARVKYSRNKKEDSAEFKAIEEKFIVRKREKKNEAPTYDWSRFNAILVKIAIAKIASI